MDLTQTVEALEHYGSDQDPVIYRGEETTPRELAYHEDLHPGSGTDASKVRLTYWGHNRRGEFGPIRGTLSGMLAERRRMRPAGKEHRRVQCPTCGRFRKG